MKQEQIIPLEHIERFITSGKATLVLYNEKTSGSRRYQVWEKKEGLFYVYEEPSHTYLGFISHDREFKVIPEIPNILALKSAHGFSKLWSWVVNLSLPGHIKVLHTGRCGYCGRPLTDPVSILTGVGPVCTKKLEEKRQSLHNKTSS